MKLATITGISIKNGQTLLASAGSGEVGLPDEPYLTIKDAAWAIPVKSATDYLQQYLDVSGVAAQRPFMASLKLTGLSGRQFEIVKLSR